MVLKTAPVGESASASVGIGEAHARFQSVLDHAPRSAGAEAFEGPTAEIVHGADGRSGDGAVELLRSTAADADGPAEEGEAEGRGDAVNNPDTTPKRTRRVKAATAGKTRARNIRLGDDVYDRLRQLARERQQTVSAVANLGLN